MGINNLACGLIASALLTGCASLERGLGFSEVQEAVTGRTGQQIHWNKGTAEDELVVAKVRELLLAELTSDTAVQIALLNNRNLQAIYEDLHIAQADLVSAGLLRNPIFDAEVRIQNGGGTGLELALVQDFIDILYIPLRKRRAEAAFEAAKIRVTGIVLDLAAQVRRAFYAYQAAEETLELRRQVYAAAHASHLLATRLREAGNITELDLAMERAALGQASLELRSAELEVLNSREELNALMGVWGDASAWKAAKGLPEPLSPSVALIDLEARALERSLDLAAARQELDEAGAALGLAQPLEVFEGTELGAASEREGEDGKWAVGPAVSFPIPVFHQGQPARAAAEAAYRAKAERYAALEVRLRSQIRMADAALRFAKERVEFYKSDILPLRQSVVRHSQLQYNAMQIGPLALIRAREDEVRAGVSYISALKDYWVAHANFEHLLSGRMSGLRQFELSAADSRGEENH